MSLSGVKRDWEALASMDPLWAILADPARKFRKWDLDEFFATGREEVATIMRCAGRLGYPAGRGVALDFGCGVGRLTRALADHFQLCCGVDVSEAMIAQARRLNGSCPNCRFFTNDASDLRLFPDDSFDMIYTSIVLQHLPGSQLMKSYIAEFVRTLEPRGLLVFQLPSHLPLRERLQPRRRAWALLRRLGWRDRFLYEKVGLHPVRLSCMAEREVIALLGAMGATVLDVQADQRAGPSIPSKTYFATKHGRGIRCVGQAPRTSRRGGAPG